MSKTILLAGATGLVGSACLPLLLADERVGKVAALVRRPLDLQHPKLEQWIAPGNDLLQGLKPEPVDAVICGLVFPQIGTSRNDQATSNHDAASP